MFFSAEDYLANTNKWDGSWPTSTVPKNTLVFFLENVQRWWTCDFEAHIFALYFAPQLKHARANLRSSLGGLTTLTVIPSKLQSDEALNAIFVDVLVFCNLTVEYLKWIPRAQFAKPQDSRGQISSSYSFTPDTSSFTALQLEQIQKSKSKAPSLGKPSFNTPYKRNFNKRNQTGRNFKPFSNTRPNPGKYTNNKRLNKDSGGGPGLKSKPICFTCGKPGHKANNCRQGVGGNKPRN